MYYFPAQGLPSTFSVHLLSFLSFYVTSTGKSEVVIRLPEGHLRTDLQQVGSLDMVWHAENTPRPVLMIRKKFPLHLLSQQGSALHRLHQSSQRQMRKAQARGSFGELAGKDSRGHPFPQQRGSKSADASSDTCKFQNRKEKDYHWTQLLRFYALAAALQSQSLFYRAQI